MIKKLYFLMIYGFRFIFRKPFFLNLNVDVTEFCTQNCKMCNAELHRDTKDIIGADNVLNHFKKLKKYHFATCSLSGGEPTLVSDIWKVFPMAKKQFPFGVLLLSNLYGNKDRIFKIMEEALKNGIDISISFDGFGEVADKLRGAKRVSEIVEENLWRLKELREATPSKSKITLHTVMCDDNLDQVPDIINLSKKLGFKQSITVVNSFFYLDEPDMPQMTKIDKLVEVVNLAIEQEHITQNREFLKGIVTFSKGEAPKLCPYLTTQLKAFKLFLKPEGDASLCDRVPLGNIYRDKNLNEMFKKDEYAKAVESYRKCSGCWLGCFVVPMIKYKKILTKLK